MKKLCFVVGFFILGIATLSIAACGTQRAVVDDKRGSNKLPAMVVTANPLATKAGVDVIQSGGSAVDAAIAIESVLSLVEPQSSGLAGGAFMIHFEKQTGIVSAFDGRETAPASAEPDRFLLVDGSKMGYLEAKHSGLSTGVPGVIAMLQLAHAQYGVLPWETLFDAAKKHAQNGFAISPRLHGMLQRFGKYLPNDPAAGPTDAYDYFFNEAGEAHPVGYILKNPDYAESLKVIANDPGDFYSGELAKKIVASVNREPRAAKMTLGDLQNYVARKRPALCSPYRTLTLCGPPPPSSWLAVAMTMGILDRSSGFKAGGAETIANWNLFGEAQRLAYADRDRFVADSDKVMVPVTGLLHPDYLARRANEISAVTAQEKVESGDPWAFNNRLPLLRGDDATKDVAGTTHFVVVDKQGNVVSMTASVESIFGSARMAGGMFLNNQLTDFSFIPTDNRGKPIANAVEAGKRPRSSMSPTIVLDENGDFKMATGSPGGNSIIAYTLKTLVGVLDWGLSPQQAVDLPNMVGRGDVLRIEKDRASDRLIAGLRDYGFNVKESAGENSGLSVVYRNDKGELEGGVDPRREGVIEVVY